VNLVSKSDSSEKVMKMIAAGGFKDITRISSSSPVMWEQICLTNRDNLLKLIDAYMLGLQDIRNKIEQSQADDIYQFFDNARIYRDSFLGTTPGALDRLFTIHVEIADRPAALAEVVMMLAVNAINIKNISISHNREFQQGVLFVEFDTQKETDKAREILQARGFHLY